MFGSSKGIKPGDTLPEITLPDQDGKPVALSSFRGRKLVVYFYPRDNTPVCTVESCTFRDSYEDFVEAGAAVVGISADDEQSHRQFADEHNLPFTLLADTQGEARRLFGVPKTLGVISGRVTYVADEAGRVLHVFNSQLDGRRHVAEALSAIRTG